jgi:hypothetical protein
VKPHPLDDARWFIQQLREVEHEWLPRSEVDPWIRKNVFAHRRDALLECLRLQRWLEGGEYVEDPPILDKRDSGDYDI